MMLLLLCCLCFVHCSLCPLCCCWMDVGLGWPGLHLCLTLTPPEMQLRAIPLTLYLSVPSRSLCTSPPRLAASPLTTDTTSPPLRCPACTVRLSVILVLYDVAAASRSGLPARLLSLSHILSPDTFHAAPKHPRRRSNDPLTTAPSQTPFLCNPLPPASHCLISSGHLPTGITRRQSSTPPM